MFSELGKGATSEAGSKSSELLMCGGGMHSQMMILKKAALQQRKTAFLAIVGKKKYGTNC